MPVFRINSLQDIEGDGMIQIARVKINDIINTVLRHKVQNFFGQLPVRVDDGYALAALYVMDSHILVKLRLAHAGHNSAMPLFHDDAITEIYQLAQGYPRRIAMVAHNALKRLVMENKIIVDRDVVRAAAAEREI